MSLLRCVVRRACSKIEIVKEATTGLRGSGELLAGSSLAGPFYRSFNGKSMVSGSSDIADFRLPIANWLFVAYRLITPRASPVITSFPC